MKRFILYSLSATIAVAFGSVARAEMHTDAHSERETSPTDGIIVPNDNEPSNRAVPEADAIEPSGEPADIEVDPLEGVISPDDNAPDNRAVPEGGAVEPGNGGEAMNETEPDPTDSIIVPDDGRPSNRVETEEDSGEY